MNCARGKCGVEVKAHYRIWNLGTDEYRIYCVKCGRAIVEANKHDELKLKYVLVRGDKNDKLSLRHFMDLSEVQISECVTVVNDWMGVLFSESQMSDLLKKNPMVCVEILKWGVFDTCVRESLMSAVGVDLVGRKCPTFSDGEDISCEFYDELKVAASARGIVVVQ